MGTLAARVSPRTELIAVGVEGQAVDRFNVVAVVWGIVVVSGAALTAFGAIAEPISLTIWMSLCAAGVVATHLTVALATEPVRRP